MNSELPKEYFDLVRSVLKEKRQEEGVRRDQEGESERRSLRRKRRRVQSRVSSASEVIDLDDDAGETPPRGSPEVIDLSDSPSISDEEVASDEFEDVTDPAIGDISVTVATGDRAAERREKVQQRNVCSPEEKQFRRTFHMLYLVCMMTHGCIRNDWCNDSKLMKRLTRLVPDKTYEMLHPAKDDEMILRSTRKLLDGLKKCMELWQTHWKIVRAYPGRGCYMPSWQEVHAGSTRQSVGLTRRQFVKNVLRGVGDVDVATQGFVALLRSCNLNARLVMSAQPPDFTNLKLRDDLSCEYADMTKFPLFWCEVWDKFSKRWITVDPMNLKTIEQVRHFSKLTPSGAPACKRNVMRYVIGYDRKRGCRDITRRYVRYLHGRTRKKRITKDLRGAQWFSLVVGSLNMRKQMRIDEYESHYFEQRDMDEGMPDNLQDLKNHPFYVAETDLRQNQILKPGCKECGYLKVSHKQDKVLKVYARRDVMDLKSARQWYNEGRILKTGARSKKVIKKARSQRRAFADDPPEEDERLYGEEDTEWYVAPLAAPDGTIKKNVYGNVEVFVDSMVPANCCLIRSPLAVKAARFIRVEHAPAVTEFRFERGHTVKPVISGVVVAQWFREAVLTAIDGIEYEQEEDQRRERELHALQGWNQLLLKIRIKANLNSAYGGVPHEEEETPAEAGGFFVPGNTTGAGHSADDDAQPDIDDEYADFLNEIDSS
ncbi:Rad4p KNAG_0G01770 [Huiozyma naganishii CBS 8797]|uniref:Rad4 beta-hairpin domain-containing protein n=1 Tax=Huiozyma naganishii (strain ATCC MYA-139 / BCRC 22969 / CBS 8797 / KCTC 17520 / NBRC 10181 / NCYC 3082 / Yp74L-3) TaxID=1071383 RepID=J7R8N5_HUIN7|nr:hypothetical protein KNAG_0G01770 [Kazachstania naganishii CBS 8797]CCK71235.1 hypothetical protein KNAG_0G01770 [Kazachstania naganishii CBS 8797]